jgi:hypothetical protein
MFSEHRVVLHVYDVHHVFHVILLQILQNSQFHSCLVVVFLFVFDYFNRDFLLFLMIEGFDGNAETTLAKESEDLVPVSNVILNCNPVVSLAVIEPEVRIFLVATSS